MLAVVGYIVGDIVRLPGEMYSFESIPHASDAHDALMFNGPMTQVAAYISLWDIIVTAPAIAAMKEGREPGGEFPIPLFLLPICVSTRTDRFYCHDHFQIMGLP